MRGSVKSMSMALIIVTMVAAAARAEEKAVQLKRAPGLDKVEQNCGVCHSLDYIQMNSPYLSSSAWEAEVAKMINAFGAQIGPADAKTVAEYLKNNYGLAERSDVPGRPGTNAITGSTLHSTCGLARTEK